MESVGTCRCITNVSITGHKRALLNVIKIRSLDIGLHNSSDELFDPNDNGFVSVVHPFPHVDHTSAKTSPEPTDPGKVFDHPGAHPDRLEGGFPLAPDKVQIAHRAERYLQGESDR